MKPKYKHLGRVVVGLLVAMTAVAQNQNGYDPKDNPNNQQKDRPSDRRNADNPNWYLNRKPATTQNSDTIRRDNEGINQLSPTSQERLGKTEKASDIIGREVKNLSDERLGKVNDLAVDMENGRIVTVILSTGGFAGIGDKHVAVPPGVLDCDTPNKVIRLNATKERVKDSPSFDMSKWQEGVDRNQVMAVYRYYGDTQPYFAVETTKTERTHENANAYGYVEKASKIIGTSVKNMQDEKLGKVENLAVDLKAGRVVAAIISSGGFLGIGDELSAVPPAAFRFTADHDTLQLDTTKEALKEAPHFTSRDWPNFSEPTYTERVYRSYKVDPYFTVTTTTGEAGRAIDNAARDVGRTLDNTARDIDRAADNTARNIRDRNSNAKTPFDQGSNPADLDTTRRIRQGIVDRRDLSTSARNVKIVTVNGQVTIRGTVNTAEEKRLIGEIAAEMARGDKVDNQLEVSK